MGDIKVDLDKDEEEKLRQISEKQKSSMGDVAKVLLKEILNEKGEDLSKHIKNLKELSSVKGDGEGMIDKIMSMLLMKEIIGKKDDTGDMMKYAMLKQMLSPSQDPIMTELLKEAISKKSGGSDDILKMYLQQQAQNQQLLMQMMFNKKFEEQQKSHEELKGEMFKRFQELENVLYALSQNNQQPPPSVVDELEKYKKIRQSLMSMAEDLGIKKTEITTPEGKVNWGGIAEKFLGLAGKALDKFGSARRPTISLPQPVIPNMQPPAQNSEPKFEIQPKIEEVSKNAVPSSANVNQLPNVSEPTASETGNTIGSEPVGVDKSILPPKQPYNEVYSKNGAEVKLGPDKIIHGEPQVDIGRTEKKPPSV